MASYVYTVIVTFLLGGLWHGIAWTFLTWGALHGIALAAVRLYKNRQPRGYKGTPWGRACRHIRHLPLRLLHLDLLQRLLDGERVGDPGPPRHPPHRPGLARDNLTLPILGVLALAAILHCLPLKLLDRSATLLGRAPFWLQGAALAALVLLIQTLSGRGSATFIYGNF